MVKRGLQGEDDHDNKALEAGHGDTVATSAKRRRMSANSSWWKKAESESTETKAAPTNLGGFSFIKKQNTTTSTTAAAAADKSQVLMEVQKGFEATFSQEENKRTDRKQMFRQYLRTIHYYDQGIIVPLDTTTSKPPNVQVETVDDSPSSTGEDTTTFNAHVSPLALFSRETPPGHGGSSAKTTNKENKEASQNDLETPWDTLHQFNVIMLRQEQNEKAKRFAIGDLKIQKGRVQNSKCRMFMSNDTTKKVEVNMSITKDMAFKERIQEGVHKPMFIIAFKGLNHTDKDPKIFSISCKSQEDWKSLQNALVDLRS